MWMKKKNYIYIYIYINTLNNKIYKPLGWSGSRKMGLDQQNLFLPKMEWDNVNHEECGIFYIPKIKFFVTKKSYMRWAHLPVSQDTISFNFCTFLFGKICLVKVGVAKVWGKVRSFSFLFLVEARLDHGCENVKILNDKLQVRCG